MPWCWDRGAERPGGTTGREFFFIPSASGIFQWLSSLEPRPALLSTQPPSFTEETRYSVWVHWLRGNIWWVYLCWTVGVYGQFVTLKCINCFLTSIQPLVMPAGATGPGTWLLIPALVQQPESAKFPFLSVQKRRKSKKDLKMLE